jgi:hypothetical protein
MDSGKTKQNEGREKLERGTEQQRRNGGIKRRRKEMQGKCVNKDEKETWRCLSHTH